MRTQKTPSGRLEAGAGDIVQQAQVLGERLGELPEGAAVHVLEQALAFAYAQAAHFRGADNSGERLEITVNLAQARFIANVPKAIRRYHFMLQGEKTFT